MTAPAPVTFRQDVDGLGWITFDAPGARANVFTPATQAALASALDAVDAAGDALEAVVIVSGKERIFVAGADLRELAALPDVEAARTFARRGQALFQRVAHAKIPFVCAIHGACAGGGFELALACRYRLASDAAATQIGLPETSIGTIPGWGGSVRLPRLVGVKPALEHILRGQLVSPARAAAAGLVDEIVPAEELQSRARLAALRLAREGMPLRTPPAQLADEVIASFRADVERRHGRSQPALLAAIEAVERTAQVPEAEALEIEATLFGDVTAGETCKNLIRVFFLREAAKKRTLDDWFPVDRAATRESDAASRGGKPELKPIRRVGVVGAGVMGAGIAQWLGLRGFDVVMRDAQPEALQRGLEVVRGLFDEAVKRGRLVAGEANRALQRIDTTSGWDGFESCDLVIEAIVENAEAKRKLFSELARIVRADAVLASNTSALPIEEIAGEVPHPERTIGIHFFNPVGRMSLVELVLAPATSAETAARALAWVRELGKVPIVCRSSPGFFTTRVLFFYLNAAVHGWEEGMETSAVDAAMRDFGWPMGPLRLIDEVGLDVTDFIFGEMEHYFPARFRRSTACARLLAAGLRGRKNGASRGFYRYDAGGERANDEETRAVVSPRGGGRPAGVSVETKDIAARLMRVMAEEAQRCLDEGVVKTADEIDFALLSGAGFPAFRGGLLHWARAAGLLRRE